MTLTNASSDPSIFSKLSITFGCSDERISFSTKAEFLLPDKLPHFKSHTMQRKDESDPR
ncbi:hypothetical protein LguiA_031507 [Lonicera macranthoides]